MQLPHLMAILNVTPDSFSDGAQFATPDEAVSHGMRLAREGAHAIDVGGESTRPGAERVSVAEQIDRVVPVISKLRPMLDGAGFGHVTLSIDTTRAAVAQAALDAGARLVNDVSAGEEDPELFPLVAKTGARICLMHRQGTPETMQKAPTYGDVLIEVRNYLLARAQAAQQAGIPHSRIWLDPGIGFGKTFNHNIMLMKELPEFVATGYPILLGASRKRWIAEVMAGQSAVEANDRLGGSIAASLWAAQCGVAVVRVHDVAPHVQALAALQAIRNACNGSPIKGFD